MDFNIEKYKELLHQLIGQDYSFQTFKEFLEKPKNRVVILRHDVDLLPHNSLRFAKIQNELQIKGTFYFREVSQSWNEEIMIDIANMGHEIGYHYETMDTAKGNIDLALQQFKEHLDSFRRFLEIKTICMHGSPRSKYDNRLIWNKFNYRDFDIIGEPYYDINFNDVFYLTDTGRRWDGQKVSVRDKVNTLFNQSYRSTNQVIEALSLNELPNQIMFTFHPQRWHDNMFLWVKEFLMQNGKNIIKKYFFVK